MSRKNDDCSGSAPGEEDECNARLRRRRDKLKETLKRVMAKPYLKTIGAKVSPHYTLEELECKGLTRSLRTIRIKDLSCILGKEDEMLENIYSRSGASIAIITDLRAVQYHEAIIEFSGTAVEIQYAINYVSEAITARYLGKFVPQAMMTLYTVHEKMPLYLYQAIHLFNMKSLVEIESKSSTWLKVEASEPPADEKTSRIDIQISGTLENIKVAKRLINSVVSRAKAPKMFELRLGKFRWESIREAALKKFVWGCGGFEVKTQTGEDKRPINNAESSTEAHKVPSAAEVNNEVPSAADRDAGPSMSYTAGGSGCYAPGGGGGGYYAPGGGYYGVNGGYYTYGVNGFGPYGNHRRG